MAPIAAIIPIWNAGCSTLEGQAHHLPRSCCWREDQRRGQDHPQCLAWRGGSRYRAATAGRRSSRGDRPQAPLGRIEAPPPDHHRQEVRQEDQELIDEDRVAELQAFADQVDPVEPQDHPGIPAQRQRPDGPRPGRQQASRTPASPDPVGEPEASTATETASPTSPTSPTAAEASTSPGDDRPRGTGDWGKIASVPKARNSAISRETGIFGAILDALRALVDYRARRAGRSSRDARPPSTGRRPGPCPMISPIHQDPCQIFHMTRFMGNPLHRAGPPIMCGLERRDVSRPPGDVPKGPEHAGTVRLLPDQGQAGDHRADLRPAPRGVSRLEHVFKDVDDIPHGSEWLEEIHRRLEAADLMVVVIGPDWLDLVDDRGRRRLDDPEDVLRGEIGKALRRKIPILPLTVDGASMPDGRKLPGRLRALAGYQGKAMAAATPISHADMDRVLEAIAETLGVPVPPLRGGSAGPGTLTPPGLNAFRADQKDAFLDLLPGRRGADGLPPSLSFWRRWIERRPERQRGRARGDALRPERRRQDVAGGRVGLVPRLDPSILVVSIDATTDGTEAALGRGAGRPSPRRSCAPRSTPASAWNRCSVASPSRAARSRRTAPDRRRSLEQWAQSHAGEEDSLELAGALKVCENRFVLALLLVREEYLTVAGPAEDHADPRPQLQAASRRSAASTRKPSSSGSAGVTVACPTPRRRRTPSNPPSSTRAVREPGRGGQWDDHGHPARHIRRDRQGVANGTRRPSRPWAGTKGIVASSSWEEVFSDPPSGPVSPGQRGGPPGVGSPLAPSRSRGRMQSPFDPAHEPVPDLG